MLKLEGMEIAGFKSFRQRVNVRFPEGITGVVGPNGCGKSNLLDAICWALGEQSAVALRGQRMGDLIFNGTRNRKPAPMAEVALKLKGSPSDDEDKLHLTRRLYQSGDSEYLLNGEKVRLKDITEKLLGTGIGVRAYSIIHQGKVEEILSSRPEERRILIEEAAGITRYRSKRRSANLKLERTEQDLLRVEDILTEVGRQRNSLKRQASAARRFRKLKNRERFLLRLEFGFRWRELEAARLECDRAHQEARAGHTRATSQTAEAEAHLEQLRVRLETESERLGELRDAEHQRAREIDRLEHKISTGRERAAEADQEIGLRRERSRELGDTLDTTAREIDELETEFEEAEQNLQKARTDLDAAEGEFRQARLEQENLEEAAEEAREGVFDASASRADHGNTAESERSAAERALAVAERHRGQADEVGAEADRAEEACSSAEFGLKAAREELDSARQVLEGAQQAVRATQEDLEKARGAREEAVRQESREESRLTLLRRLDEEGERCAEGVRALLEAAREAGVPGFRGLLADHLEVEPGAEEAVEAVLRERLQWVVVEGREAALAASRRVLDGRHGGASLLYGAPHPTDQGSAAPAPEGARALRDLVRTEDPSVAGALGEWLAGAWLVEDPEKAARLAGERSGETFVTPQGLCWGPGPLLHQLGAGAEGGVLRLKREIREAEEALQVASHQRASQEARCTRLEGELVKLQQAREERTEKAQTAERQVVEAQHAVQAATRERDRLREQRKVLLDEEANARREARAHQEAAEEAEARAEEAEERRVEESERLEDLRRRTEGLESRIGSLEHELRRLREVLADRRETREAARLRLEHARARKEESAEARQRMDRETRELEARKERLLEEVAGAEGRLEERLREGEESRGDLREAEEAVTGTRLELQETEARLKELREAQEKGARSVSDIEVRLAGITSDREHVRRECRADLDEVIEQVVAEAPPLEAPPLPAEEGDEEDEADTPEAPRAESWDDPALPDPEVVSEELQEVRRKLERIGSVNLVAIEEFEELDQRWSFLKEQKTDIEESIESLRRTIREIDRISRERFLETFEGVREYFIENFKILFKGGQADIRLEEGEDVLEAGIEVFAQPPGKRLQNIRLLSGGEKALSAIALLFGLFRFKPSPFCVLDEVDAPLDDVNLTRFLGLLESLQEETQFILITHNKLSMERADVLYGVTMEEPGCSKLVSVDFREATRHASPDDDPSGGDRSENGDEPEEQAVEANGAGSSEPGLAAAPRDSDPAGT